MPVSDSTPKLETRWSRVDTFERARSRGLSRLHERQGIGTQGERSLHVILKYWIDPDECHHEVMLGLGKMVADVFDGRRVFEIQTRNFNTLRPKLERILPEFPVTVVFPLAREKRLIWVDPETGETTKPRRSPKTGSVWDAFFELYKIKMFLCHECLTIKLVFLDIEEYRLQDGWSYDRKRGSHRMERIPYALVETVDLITPADFAALLPDDLPNEFTSADLAVVIHIPKNRASKICNILYTIGAIIRTGKKANAYLYEKNAAE
ncbi:MAG TPA: hypothetical protein DEB10_07655 [Ruminococcaceae bacterium]|nr:hypothetical protein [Oscillospiraceae bacterium]